LLQFSIWFSLKISNYLKTKKINIHTPKNISIKSTLNKIQYSTQLILVLNQYFKKVLKFKSILVLFQIKLLNVSKLVSKFHKKIRIDTFKFIKLQFDTLTKF
jgi:hypothetical protein